MSPVAGPFYLAWVDATETTFGLEHHRMDEYVYSVRRTLSEGQKPVLEIEIENPRVGLLSTNRKTWAWVSWFNGTTIVPLLFGHLVGNPVQLTKETMTIQLIADPKNYKHQVQMLAESMKVLPYWDPVWIEVGKRDDPDKILETYAAFWDVHPTNHDVIAVGLAAGPAGNIDLTEGDYFYGSFSSTTGQPPETSILMDATVPWTQSSRGIVYVGSHIVRSYSNAIISGWPKPLTQLGSGWSVYASNAFDSGHADMAESVSISYSWQNKEKHHSNGDTMSLSVSQTVPKGPVGTSKVLTQSSQTGLVDPFAVDEDGDPSPLNIPATYNETSVHALTYTAVTTLTLEYRAERPRTERVIFTINADVQPILVDPTVDQVSEIVTMTGADVGVPIINLLNWTTVSGQHVEVGQVIFPDDPQVPGGRTAQIAVAEGDAGTEPPNFSDILGDETVDGTVTWSSLGSAEPPDNSRDWQFGSPITAGTIILPRRPFFAQLGDLLAPGQQVFPPQEVQLNEGTYFQSGSNFGVVVLSGKFGTSAQIAGLNSLPSGSTYFMALNDGTTGPQYLIPDFGSHETLHDRVTDNGIVWQSIGSGEIPIGGVPGEIRSPTFFCQERGLRSLEYLALVLRAKLQWRCRCVDVSFETDWLTGYTISTRNTVTLHNPDLPGGIAFGKVKTAVLSFSDTEPAICQVTISCLIGKDNAIEEVQGEPEYCDDDYCDDDYQFFAEAVVLLPTGSDLSYTPPTYRVIDDGLTFPLDRGQILLVDLVHGTDQTGDVQSALDSMAQAANIVAKYDGTNAVDAVYNADLQRQLLSANSISKALEDNPTWIEYQFKPVNAGPFHSVVHVKFSEFTMERGIDLESEVTT